MMDFFYRHYEPWVDHFFVYDDGSIDGSAEYLKAKTNTSLAKFERSDPNSLILSGKIISDQMWKRSIGIADWVVVVDMDEHVTHKNMQTYLQALLEQGVTAAPALGYQMVVDEYPRPDSTLAKDHTMGAPWRQMSKLSIFRPDAITATNFAVGRHSAQLEGEVVFPVRDDIANLHYKYLGLAETHSRHLLQRERLEATDRSNNWGHKYHWSLDQLAADFDALRPALVDTSTIDHHTFHQEPRWWRQ